VNAEIRLVPDQQWQGREDYWSFPLRGAGDCEDLALEKRRRLVELGLPRGAMTLAIVYHQNGWGPHVILLIETSAGTFALDNRRADVPCWNEVPYNYETRERPDGRWARFDQAYWKRE
jgi:predicted transglutaminase-like cysteine proteinase